MMYPVTTIINHAILINLIPQRALVAVLSWLYFKPSQYTLVGLGLLLLFILQYGFSLAPQWLLDLQNIDTYKELTGFLLFAGIGAQWRLASVRREAQNRQRVIRARHERYGVFLPLLLFVHSVDVGYAYEALLATVFLCNSVVGMLNPRVFRLKFSHYFASWLICHVVLAVMLTTLLGYHIYIVYIY